MEKQRLYQQSLTLKWVVTLYLFLCSVGFGVAALISHNRYKFDHEMTAAYFLGSQTQLIYPKLYTQIIQVAHVHSFTLPLVFLMVWLGLCWVPIRSFYRLTTIFGGALGILLYNAAPFLVRYHSANWVFLFTLGGILLFLFFFLAALLILTETWLGFRPR